MAELDKLSAFAQSEESSLRPSDLRYYLLKLREGSHDAQSVSSAREPSLQQTLDALLRVTERVFGIKVEEVRPSRGEVWGNEVRRFNVKDESGALMGVIYMELLTQSNRARATGFHSTVQCAKLHLAWDEMPPWVDWDELMQFHPKELFVKDITSSTSSERVRQLPVVVVNCPFDTASELKWSDVELLFHEMGHALHSMSSRCGFQHTSGKQKYPASGGVHLQTMITDAWPSLLHEGTRTSIDFAEIPSVFLEYFSHHPSTWESFGIIPPLRTESPLLRENQIFCSILDQALHSPHFQDPSHFTHHTAPRSIQLSHICRVQPDKLWPTLVHARSGVPSTVEVQSIRGLGHIVGGYKAGYYTYLWSGEIASAIWQRNFTDVSKWRESGQLFRDELLSWGGGRDPWACVMPLIDEKDWARLAS